MKKLFLNFCWFTALSLPVILFLHTFIFKIHGILPGDWDYFAQLYEAARQSILHYHQFPWWNPWVAGGVPLYGNPQFGLISIQMPCVLIFGTLAGLHIAVLVYFLVGFWGMYRLLLRIGASKVISILLSYIWIFSGFPVWHIAGGHLTFGTYLLAPWFFYLLLNIRKRWGWLWIGLFTAFLMNQGLHYMTVHILVIGLSVVLYQLIRHQRKYSLSLWELIKPYLLSTMAILPLTIHKLFYTLQYIHDYTRIPGVEPRTPINIIVAALTFRGTKVLNPTAFYSGGFGWAEYAAYFGLLTLGLFAYLIIKDLEKPRSLKLKYGILLGGVVLVLLLALGNFSPLSPYSLMKRLPVFDEMQVASRWLGWFIFGVILYLAKLPKKKVIIIALAVSVLDVFQSNYRVINYNLGVYTPPIKQTSTITQDGFYSNRLLVSLNSQRYLYATQSNIGDIYGYEPIVGFGGDINQGYIGLSSRCAANLVSTCSFVMTNNAIVTYWSPDRIELRRTGSGEIFINENAGSYWLVNGKRTFEYMKVTELKQLFKIMDPSQHISLEIMP